MMKLHSIAFALFTFPLAAQNPSGSPDETWKALSFLEGTWEAKAEGSAGAVVSGSYTFRQELAGHILARHSTTDPGCKAPESFDCNHGDLLYIFRDAPGQPLKAIYFDNEGHVIHYNVSVPTPTSVMFLSDSSQPGPQFRLVYQRNESIMSGKFQMQMPGQTEWKSYLEWSGKKK